MPIISMVLISGQALIMIPINIILILPQGTELNILFWMKAGTSWVMCLIRFRGLMLQELCRYAASKNVGVILWVVWKSFWDDIDEAVALYEKWGVKGVKVDFMQRDDQKVVNFYHGSYQENS